MKKSVAQKIGILSLFFIVVLLAFGQSIWHGFAPVDDSFLIVENLAVRGMTWDNLVTVFTTYDPELYIPFIFLSYQLNYMIGGLDPMSFHITNILLHTVNALLVFGILWRLSRQKYLSLFAGLLFAVHPLHTEAVVWLAGRKDLLAATFFFASLYWYLRGVDGSKKAFVVSVLLFACALFSKVIAVTLLGVIIMHAILIEKPAITSKTIARFTPYIVLAIIFMIIALGGKSKVINSIPMSELLLLAPKSMVFYLQKLVVPTGLVIIYPFQSQIALSNPAIFIPLLVSIACCALAIRSWYRAPWITFAIGWYVCTLAPTFLNASKAGLVFFAVDRYAYLPSVAFLFFVVMLLSSVLKGLGTSPKTNAIAGAVIVCISMGLSALQTRVWSDPVGLFQHNLEVYPESVGVRIALSNLYRKQNRLQQAFDVLKDGLAYNDHALLHYSAGLVYAKDGKVRDARNEFEKAAEMNSNFPDPIFSIGSLLDQTGRSNEAVEYYQKALELDDSYVIARARVANNLRKSGDLQQAKEQLDIALQQNSSSFEAQYVMGLTQQGLQNHQQAVVHLETARELQPNSINVLNALAVSYIQLQQIEKATKLLEQVLLSDPDNVDARLLLRDSSPQ